MRKLKTARLRMVAEPELVQRARAGDIEAFDDLYRGRFKALCSFLFRLVGNPEDAEDLAQECFLRAHQALPNYRGSASFGNWLRSIALNLSRDHWRSRGRTTPVLPLQDSEEDLASSFGLPLEALGSRERTRVIENAVNRLPETLRVTLIMRVLEGLSYEEISEVTGCKPGTARTQVMKARRLLSQVLEPWMKEGGR